MFEILRKDIVLDIQRAEVERGPTTAALRVVWEVVFGITIMIMIFMIITIIIIMIKSPISSLMINDYRFNSGIFIMSTTAMNMINQVLGLTCLWKLPIASGLGNLTRSR